MGSGVRRQRGDAAYQNMLRARRASSDMRLMSQGGSNIMFTLTWPTPGTGRPRSPPSPASRRPPGSPAPSASCRSRRCGRRRCRAVDEAELVDVGRDLRIVDGLQRGDDVGASAAPAPPAGWRAAATGVAVDRRSLDPAAVAAVPELGPRGLQLFELPHRSHRDLKRTSRARLGSASTSASTSALVLYMANEARHVAVTPKPLHQRLRAMVPGPHRHALAVDDGRDVVRMQPVHGERDDAALAGRRP